MFVYKSRFMRHGEVWYDDEPGTARVDWIHYQQRSQPVAHCRWKYFYTRVVDLCKPVTELFAEMDERTRRKIEEARTQDRLRCVEIDPQDTAHLDAVEAMWNQFAAAQNTPVLERPWVDQMAAARALHLTAAKDPAGSIIAYHLVFLTPNRARQMIAISPYRPVPTVAWRNAVSRANSFLHWENFLTYKQKGIPQFDFGGWYPGKTDIRLLGMNSFKKGFGGRVVRDYECVQPITPKGWTLLTLARWLKRIRSASPEAVPDTEDQNYATPSEEPKVSPAFR